MPKILIFTASYGGGHNSVAKALSEYFHSHYPKTTVEVVDFMERFVAGDKIMRMLYKQSTKRLPAAYGLFFNVTDKLFTKPLGKKILTPPLDKVRRFLKESRPDIVVSVYPTAGIVSSMLSRELGFRTATIITDFGAHSQWISPKTDLYFVPTDNLKKFLASKGIKPGRIKVTGIPIRQAFSGIGAPAKRHPFTVLLMSGEYGIGKIRKLCQQLAKLPIRLIMVCGNNKRLFRKVSELKKKNRARNLTIYGFTDQVHKLMVSSDLLIGKAGGITVSEAMALGLPIIIYRPIPGQEIFNLDYLVNQGAALYARNRADAVAKVRFLSENSARLREMKTRSRKIGRPDATARICKHLINL
ncbi:MAG: glycosyltransferase [Planctomycetes bacterium]|nr:glycosyltransferase [Planctomycetota bacterium]